MKDRRYIFRFYAIRISFALITVGMLSAAASALESSETQNTRATSIPGQIAPRLQNLGNHTFSVTTDSARAQLFINQGMMLTYGFNHAEAERSFREAARLDPECAMAYWGIAYVLGPNINMPMAVENEPKAFAMIQKAMLLRHGASAKEQALIEALSKRYSDAEKPFRPSLDRAYAQAIRDVSHRYPDDLDISTLYAEAIMTLSPWDYWTRDYKPYPDTEVVMSVLESVLARNPNHPGAIHLYIHAVELGRPELAEAAAERLWTLAPGAGHLVHMPSHIFRRIGRYADASKSNQDAIAADEDYITQCRAQGVYPLAYYPHNIHFLWDSATMEGRSRVAIEAARKSSSIPEGAWKQVPLLHQFLVAPLFAYTRFGKWENILAEPQPPVESPFWTGIWHYTLGLAYIAKGKTGKATRELEHLQAIAGHKSMDGLRVTFSRNGAKPILDIAVEVLSGELAAGKGDFNSAIARLHRGVLLEDNLIYNEPPDWHVPVRQVLGAVLLEAGRPAEAEAVYWQDLTRNRDNGWSLYGLAQSLRAQGKTEQAELIDKRFDKAWQQADVKLTASRFMTTRPPSIASKEAATR